MFDSHKFAARWCSGFPVAVLFPDVEPEELAREAAHDARRIYASRGFAEWMCRQAIAAGAVHRARYWRDIADGVGAEGIGRG